MANARPIRTAFWNVQNLFDTTASAIAADLEFTPEEGWTPAVLEKKLDALAKVVNAMFDGEGPELLGLCEVENKNVVERLAGLLKRKLRIAHVESPDIRGIDASLLYSSDRFQLAAGDKPIGHRVSLLYPTRDIFEVPLVVKGSGAELTVLVNHWPSRRKGRYETEPHRIVVANQCGTIVQNLLKLPRGEFLALPDKAESLERLNARWNRNVLLMGDFNDAPYDRSVLSELRAASGCDKIEEPVKSKNKGTSLPETEAYLKRQPTLFNCMWRLLGKPDAGTYFFSSDVNTMVVFDQFVISRGLLYGYAGLKLPPESVSVFKDESMTTVSGRPRKFKFKEKGKPSSRPTGVSDHFPITALIELN